MGLKMDYLVNNMQNRMKSSSIGILTTIFKLFSGFILGLTFALIGQVMVNYGDLAFFMVIVVFAGVFMKISKTGGFGVLCLIYFVYFVGMLLWMYILIALGV